MEVDPKTLFNEMLFNFENIPTWNKAITLGRVVQVSLNAVRTIVCSYTEFLNNTISLPS